MKLFLTIAAALAITLAGLPQAKAGPSAGYTAFCARSVDNCPYNRLTVVEWSFETKDMLEKAANQIHWGVAWEREPKGVDVWQCSDKGDCEDMAICTRELLVSMGLPRSAMRIGLASVYRKNDHAFVAVYTDHGWKAVQWGKVFWLNRSGFANPLIEGGKWTRGQGSQWLSPARVAMEAGQ